ncbi:MAG: class I tRNA ligase family protein, partial [Proteobacteria bacterium]|nr:class I tRNA ligase family protein [Pseudomonadota bacterium]
DANAAIVARLRDEGTLLCERPLEHSYPHCWRHHKPIIFRATPQWFIMMDRGELRERALQMARQVQWHPQWGEVRISKMIADRPDWCISRQRRWGVPLPFFFHKDTRALHPRTAEIVDAVADMVERDGIEAWFAAEAGQFLQGNEASEYLRCTDVADVWLDSGLTHATVLRKDGGLAVPADLYLEGSDQYRGWFQSSLLTSVALFGSPPYRQVLTHGFVVDENGHKMSKSVGNVIDPADVIKRYGADVLRLWVASTDYSAEMRISDQIVERTVDSYRRLRNTLRFLLGNTSDFDPAQDSVPLNDCVEVDRWALCECFTVQERVQDLYMQYKFHIAVREIVQFYTVTLGAFYLDVLKDRLYTSAANGVARRSAQTAMYLILTATTRWLAPILSFTAE